jgi:predicted O-methyltransferase YrrM
MTLQDFYRQRCEADTDINEHLPTLYELVLELNAQQVIELGVRWGDSTSAFLAALEQTGGKLWSCDIVEPLAPIASFWGRCPHWTFVLGDDQDLADEAPDGVDILFIDTSHEYEHTLWEMEHYGSKVRSGGRIVLHDTMIEAVVESIEMFLRDREWEYTNTEACNGLGIIYKP